MKILICLLAICTVAYAGSGGNYGGDEGTVYRVISEDGGNSGDHGGHSHGGDIDPVTIVKLLSGLGGNHGSSHGGGSNHHGGANGPVTIVKVLSEGHGGHHGGGSNAGPTIYKVISDNGGSGSW